MHRLKRKIFSAWTIVIGVLFFCSWAYADLKVEVWVNGLEVPWSLLFLDDKRALVSERPGRIRLIREGKLLDTPYAVLDVEAIGEGGLMGLAKHPRFPHEPHLYAMYTYREGERIGNRVVRLRDEGERGVVEGVIVDGIPGARFHNGGRIAFGPDGMLYITTGEIFQGELAQDLTSLGGKILRVTPEGDIPSDNPFPGSPIYSLGHRNPQGLAWHPQTKELFASEHGPSGEGFRRGHDEINRIVKGGNYGWPRIVGRGNSSTYIDPVVLWTETTPPAGMTFVRSPLFPNWENDLLVATLRSQALVRIRLRKTPQGYQVVEIEELLKNRFGRLRDIVEGPDGALYLLTSNRDGRGRPLPGDDTIYRLLPEE